MEVAIATDSESTPTPSLPLKLRILLFLNSLIIAFARRLGGTLRRRLLNLIDLKSPPDPNPRNNSIKTYDITIHNPTPNLWFRVFTPTNSTANNLPIIVYFHGGGFVYFHANSRFYDHFCRRLAAKVGAVVVSLDYRLAPEHRYPAQYDDGFDLLKFLDGNGLKLLPEFADLSCCIVAGDSAGGNIAHHVVRRACESQFHRIKVVGLVAIQPFFGGEERTESEKKEMMGVLSVNQTDRYWKSFLPEGCDRDHEAVNVSGPNAVDISKLNYFPATLMLIGGLDILQDWQRRYYEWLKRNGKEIYKVEYPRMMHGFYVFTDFNESDQLISEVKKFVHKYSSISNK